MCGKGLTPIGSSMLLHILQLPIMLIEEASVVEKVKQYTMVVLRHERNTAERGGVPPDWLELMRDMHTNKQTGEVQDPVARELLATLSKLKEDK
ncbi:hypothetical protein YC2023_116374 [Brassica napus]